MPLDTAVRTRPLTTTLHYLRRGPEKPVRYVFDPPPGVPQWNGLDDPREIRIEDGRGRTHDLVVGRAPHDDADAWGVVLRTHTCSFVLVP